MKIGRLHIILTKSNESILIIDRKFSWLDNQRVTKLLNGGYHVHKNPKKKPLFNLPPPLGEEGCQPETCAGQCQGMNSKPECPNVLCLVKEIKFPDHKQEELTILRGK